jgi:hypothetical protein
VVACVAQAGGANYFQFVNLGRTIRLTGGVGARAAATVGIAPKTNQEKQKMKRIRPLLTCAAAIATISALALPALAQTPPPAGGPPPDATTAAPAAPSPMAPMVMAKSADDMTGSLGFGIGVAASTQLVGTVADVALKYWMHDNMALVPSLAFTLKKTTGVDTAWTLNPQLVLLFVPFKSTSTRLEIGGGLGFAVAGGGGTTSFNLNIPITGGVEHFFTRWFSMGIAVGENFFTYTHPGAGAPNTIAFDITTSTTFLGSLFFYTD